MMGARNALLVYLRWPGLPDLPFRLLVFMALKSMDGDDEPRYWGGRSLLADAAGRALPACWIATPEEDRRHRAAFRAVDRAVQTLVKAGAITLVESAHRGRYAVYALNLPTAPALPQWAKESTTLSVDHSGEKGTRSVATKVHAQRGPKEERRREEPLARARTRATEQIVLDATDATPDEAAAVVKLIISEKKPRSPVGLICRLAEDGELPDWLDRVRAEANRAASVAAERDAPRCPKHPWELAANCRVCRSEQIGG